MPTHLVDNNTTTIGTLGGTLLTILVNIHSSDILKTGILAAVGALVSFGVTLSLKALIKKLKRNTP